MYKSKNVLLVIIKFRRSSIYRSKKKTRMEKINCKKLFIGALLAAFGSAQIAGQYVQAPTNAYVPVSLPESVTISGNTPVAPNVVVNDYSAGQVLSGLTVNSYAQPVLNTLSGSFSQNTVPVGSQVSGSVVDQNGVLYPQVQPVNYQLGYQQVLPVQPIQQVVPVQPVQAVQPVYGTQYVPTQQYNPYNLRR